MSLLSIPAVCLRGRRWTGRCPECGQTAENASGAVFKKNHSQPASLPYFPQVWDRRRKVFFTFGGVSSSISDEELRNAADLEMSLITDTLKEKCLFICMIGSLIIQKLTSLLFFPLLPFLQPPSEENKQCRDDFGK